MMTNAVIMLLTTLLFGKMIYWMHENRNNLGEAVKESLQTIFWCIVGIAVVVAVIAGGFWLLIQFACEYPLLFIVLLFVMANVGKKNKRNRYISNSDSYQREENSEWNEMWTRIGRRAVEEKIRDKEFEIGMLKQERDSLTIKNGIILGGSLSEYELQQNREKYDELEKQIQDKYDELEELKNRLNDWS